jgi:hypothetical protein
MVLLNILKANQIYLLHLQLQTFILFTYGENDGFRRNVKRVKWEI